jgi:hypothetical protein
MDSALGGGLPRRGVSEVWGVAGSGKTQLALRCLLSSLVDPCSGLVSGRSVYLCSEGRAPTGRLHELARAWCARGCGGCELGVCGGGMLDPAALLGRVLVREVEDAPQLWQALEELAAFAGAQRDERVTLIVVDSIAALFRHADDLHGARHAWLYMIAKSLAQLGEALGCPVLVTNQASSWSGRDHPALGLAWSQCLNARVCLREAQPPVTAAAAAAAADDDDDEDDGALTAQALVPRGVRILEPSRRTLEVDFSPLHPDVAIDFVVLPGGLCAGAAVLNKVCM